MARLLPIPFPALFPLFLLLLLHGQGSAASPCEEVPWQPRRSVLLVTTDLQHSLPQRALLQAATLLTAADLSVEVAALSVGPLHDAYRKLNVPVHLVQPADRTPCGMMQEAEKLYRTQPYAGMVFAVTNFFDAYHCVLPLPGAFSMLWVLEDHWPAAVEPADMDFTGVLRFDYVVFWTTETLVRYAALVNPTGHLPISFAVLNHTAAVHPTVEVPLHWMAGALLRRLATDLHPSSDAEQPGEVLLNPAHLTIAPDVPETCPHNWFSQLAVMVHLGRHGAQRLQEVFPVLKPHARNVHLWVTYTHMQSRRDLLDLRNRSDIVYHPLMVRDHGLDLGPFFVLLWHFARCQYRYTYLLKYHFKSEEDHEFARQAALFWRQPQFFATALQHLKHHTNVSAVYGRIPGIRDLTVARNDKWFFGYDLPYIRDIQASIPVPIPQASFLAGSVWLARASTLTHWLRNTAQLWTIYSQLNDPMGLDWRWYCRKVLSAECNRSAAQLHYYMKGRHEKKPPNCYAPIPGYFEWERDGMIEHAWERVLSYMLSYYGPFQALVPQ
eukprot:EG_transcript_8120